MTSAGGTGAGSPLIVGAAVSSGDFHDFDDDFGPSNLFDFSNSPDTLQSLESIGAADQKTFLSPQELAPDPLPGSPSESYHDDSSESASSSNRTGSSASAKTSAAAADSAMGHAEDVKMEWTNPDYRLFDDDDNAFAFGRDADAPVMMDGIYGFGDHDDAFMDRSFDFDGASSSPEAASTVPVNMPSPEMPTIKTNSPRRPDQARGPRPAAHRKQVSVSLPAGSAPNAHLAQQYSMIAVSMNGLKTTGSREVSPMSAMVASNKSSPAAAAAFFSSPSPRTGRDLAAKNINGNPMWLGRMDAARPDAMPPMPFGGPPPVPLPQQQQAPLFSPPLFCFSSGYELRIMPTPLKSRVETQIPIKMTLSPLPPGVTRLHLPAHTISKPKLLAKPLPPRSPDMLELYVTLVCTSAMEQPGLKQKALERAARLPQRHLPEPDEENAPQNGGDVRICQGCITRERKRAARKKIKNPDEEKLWSLDEERRVIVFNTHEVKEWQPLSGLLDPSGRPEAVAATRAMQIDAPMRIACYCRHHNEKMGFNVIFTIKDFQDRVIAQAMSNPIMITDDHKTHPMAQPPSQPAMSEAVTSSTVPAVNPPPPPPPPPPADASNALSPAPSSAFRMSPASGDGAAQRNAQQASTSTKTTPVMATATAPTRAMSRPPSPGLAGPMAKKRKASGSASRVPNGLAMTRLETSPPPGSQAATSTQLSTATSPFSPNPPPFPQLDHMFGGPSPFANGPPTPGGQDQSPFYPSNRSASMDNLAMAQLYSAPASSHPSRAPSPSGLRNGAFGTPQNQFAQTLASSLYSLPMGANQARAAPTIHKIIPNEGPKMGGIEVTVLGQGFYQGLEVWFGDQKATTTTYWGDSSLVCLLPPSPVVGLVVVTFKHQGVQGAQNFPMAKEPPMFKYVDDNEDKLIRTALSVLGHKMSGQLVDVSDLARRILNNGNSAWVGGSSVGPPGGGPGFNHASHGQHLESQLLKCLDLIDLDDSAHKTRLDLTRSTGHTMLHLACSLGYHRFVAALLARGANPDARDRGGFTPLHMAAIHNHPEIVRRLMLVGADPTIRSLSGLTAADVAQSRLVLRAIRQSERRARSFSGGSLCSRASSAASLRLLWEPLAKAHTHDEPISPGPGAESPEYTSGDFDDEDPDEDLYVDARRTSWARRSSESTGHLGDASSEGSGGPASPTTQFAAIKDQLQQQLHQLQQTMALHLQSLPQMPQMPTFPGVLPDYQAYLQQAPFMRRMQQLMPGSGSRPGSQEGENAKVDSRWWDITSYMQTSAAAPPSYEDIFGRQDADTKQESAMRAAADAEADVKCSAMYDGQPSTPAAAGSRTEARGTSPGVLKIGRKHAITREQQEQFLRAHEKKLKKLSSDHNLFLIWIPLLVVMVCAMLYSYFPSLFPFLWASVRTLAQAGQSRISRTMQGVPERVVEMNA